MTDFHLKFLNAQGAAFAWIGAWLGPIFFFIGAIDKSTGHLIAGAAMIALPLFSIVSQMRRTSAQTNLPDTIVFAVVPAISLAGGVLLAVYLSPQ